MNIIFPGPYIIYAIGFGWIFLPFLLPVDILIATILSVVLTRNKNKTFKNDPLDIIIPIGFFSIALSYVVIGAILGIVGIILFIFKFKEYALDIDAQKYGLIGVICSFISILMTGLSIFFLFLLISA